MRYSKLVLITIFCIALSSGCDQELLDVSNPNAATTDTFWQTEDDAVKGTNAAYEPLTYDGMYTRFIHVAQDLRGDDGRGDSPWGAIADMGTFNQTSTSGGIPIMWDQMYQGVFRTNQVIANVPDIEMDEDLKARLIAEAKFLRSHYYFKLVKMFRNVPLILEPISDPDNYFQPQAPPEEVWNQIIADLQDAQADLPESYTEDIGRATWGAATAYLGKAYLFNEEWELADAEFKKIIDSGLYELVPDPRWNGDLEHENNAESIFEIQFSTQVGGTEIGWGGSPSPTWGERQARSITFAPVGYGWADTVPTDYLREAYESEQTVGGEDDPRQHATMFYNAPGMTVYGDDFQEVYANDLSQIFWRKYQSDIPGTVETDQGSGLNFRVMRYADVLLMYAETRNELGDQATAAQYIQMVRDRANMPDRELEFSLLSQEEMRDRIAHERLVELAGEGKRFDDIRRWGWLEDPEMLQMLQERDSEFEGYSQGREWLPIPQGELDTNPNIQQNPGYSGG